jgi:membrane associated rhomboid family serine protease
MVMPLWDDSPLKLPKWPFVTWALLVANVLVFIVQSAVSPGLQAAFDAYAMTPAAVTGALIVSNGPSPYLTLVSSTFLHADIFHLLGNMIFLWVFGDDVEEAMGPLRFLVFYFGSGVAAALAFVAAAPHSTIPLIGASGAIAGVLAGYLMFRPCQKVLVFIPYFILWFVLRPVARLDAYWVLGGWAVIQLWHISVQSHDGVAYMAHIGGFIAGAILFPVLRYRAVRLFECIRAEAAP